MTTAPLPAKLTTDLSDPQGIDAQLSSSGHGTSASARISRTILIPWLESLPTPGRENRANESEGLSSSSLASRRPTQGSRITKGAKLREPFVRLLAFGWISTYGGVLPSCARQRLVLVQSELKPPSAQSRLSALAPCSPGRKPLADVLHCLLMVDALLDSKR